MDVLFSPTSPKTSAPRTEATAVGVITSTRASRASAGTKSRKKEPEEARAHAEDPLARTASWRRQLQLAVGPEDEDDGAPQEELDPALRLGCQLIPIGHLPADLQGDGSACSGPQPIGAVSLDRHNVSRRSLACIHLP